MLSVSILEIQCRCVRPEWHEARPTKALSSPVREDIAHCYVPEALTADINNTHVLVRSGRKRRR
jgi:hypothetical protein